MRSVPQASATLDARCGRELDPQKVEQQRPGVSLCGARMGLTYFELNVTDPHHLTSHGAPAQLAILTDWPNCVHPDCWRATAFQSIDAADGRGEAPRERAARSIGEASQVEVDDESQTA